MTIPAGWMIEQAHRYILAARLLRDQRNMLRVSQVNAALGIEVLLKSFLATPASNHGQVNETFEVQKSLIRPAWEGMKKAGMTPKDQKGPDYHDLLTLYFAIPADVRKAAGLHEHEHLIERYRHVFTESRYGYEQGARRGHDSILTDLGPELVASVAEYAKQAGSTDPWVKAYPDV